MITPEVFHYRSEWRKTTKNIKVQGKETDLHECLMCHEVFPPTAYAVTRFNKGKVYYLDGRCRPCHRKYDHEQHIVRKNAPPRPDRCQCCHREKKLQVDHIHGSTTFRGWVCRSCNTGMGKLGDDLKGMLQAVIYLENDKNKIIETLDEVFNKMFARTK